MPEAHYLPRKKYLEENFKEKFFEKVLIKVLWGVFFSETQNWIHLEMKTALPKENTRNYIGLF